MLERLSGERDGGIEEEESQETIGERNNKDKEKSRIEVNIEMSWSIADLKTDHLNAFRVNSKRDTLE